MLSVVCVERVALVPFYLWTLRWWGMVHAFCSLVCLDCILRTWLCLRYCSVAVVDSFCVDFQLLIISWNSYSMNSPPLLCIIWTGNGYRDSQVLANSCVMFLLFLLSIRTIFNRFVTVSIIVKALSSNFCLFTIVVYGAMLTSRGARCPYCLSWFLIIPQLSGHWYSWHIDESPG